MVLVMVVVQGPSGGGGDNLWWWSRSLAMVTPKDRTEVGSPGLVGDPHEVPGLEESEEGRVGGGGELEGQVQVQVQVQQVQVQQVQMQVQMQAPVGGAGPGGAGTSSAGHSPSCNPASGRAGYGQEHNTRVWLRSVRARLGACVCSSLSLSRGIGRPKKA